MAAAAAAGAGVGRSREGTAKATVSDQISQAIQSTSNLLQLMQQSSPSQNLLSKLPKNLLAKASTIKNTGHIWLAMQGDDRDLLGNTHIPCSSRGLFLNKVIEQMPSVISALDVHMKSGLQSIPHLKTVIQLLSNMDSCQLNSASHTQQIP